MKLKFNPPCPKHHKIIDWNKIWHKFYFYIVMPQKGFIFFRHQKEVWEWKICVIFSHIPLGQQGLRLRSVELLIYTISISITIEIHKSNIDTFRVTKTTYFFPGKFYQAILLSLSGVNLYSKSLLIWIITNSTFRTVFDFKKIKIIHCWNVMPRIVACNSIT